MTITVHPLTILHSSMLMTDARSDRGSSASARSSPQINGLLSIAAALLDRQGNLLQWNAGFRRLLSTSVPALSGMNVARCFVTPSFAELVSSAEMNPVAEYWGMLELADLPSEPYPLRGCVWLSKRGVHLLAEHDLGRSPGRTGPQSDLEQSDLGQSLALRTLQREHDALKLHVQRVVETSLTDPLTGVGNRRRLDQALIAEIGRARRGREQLSAIMIDLDLFKRVNDEFGHATGDRVLTEICRRLQAHLRSSDTIARIGGEEFVVLLPNTRIKPALRKAELMRAEIADSLLPSLKQAFTASFGVAQLHPSEDGTSLLHRLDVALYRSKSDGRNRVTSAEARVVPGPPVIRNSQITHYRFWLPDTPRTHKGISELDLPGLGPAGFALELQQALRDDGLFKIWRASNAEVSEVDPSPGLFFDEDALVVAEQKHLAVELLVITKLSRPVLFQRLDLLAGTHWEMVGPSEPPYCATALNGCAGQGA
ncbi:GGDEF domain-containing protein [Pseudomarimonas salicorniae]|uniref:diguanylate cyclase n=1 Tax=Pseudomarimonas salicorniae TaxID=2933270 RepID=A0ABT0GEN6_9GAMM|nr:GGDEF domain-containing protein [Lysobacter sp. CAU 1642]MCK7593013.1 GGDEF domain-containing protein [Lysobacter sp. CAU 1642]